MQSGVQNPSEPNPVPEAAPAAPVPAAAPTAAKPVAKPAAKQVAVKKAAAKKVATQKTTQKTTRKAPVEKAVTAKSAKPAKAVKPVTPAAKVAKTVVPSKAPKVVKAVKTAKLTKSVKASKPVVTAEVPRLAKVKLVRDSFTMPGDDYALLAALKQRALKAAHPAKKSEVLRAGLRVLAGLTDAALLAALKAVPSIKTGRPKGKKPE